MKKEPKGVLLLACTQAFESFSFYGMRALLALYLISQLHYPDTSAFTLYALYIALVEIGAGISGYLADRFLGYRRAVLWGGGFILIGHICMVFSASLPLFFLGLGSIITGSTLFRTNLKALMGLLYTKEESRDGGFTWLYTGINIGGFSAAILCGIIAQIYGWHMGFGIAALGMFIGMSIFARFSPKLKEIDIEPKKSSKMVVLLVGSIACVGFAYLLKNFQVASAFFLPITILSCIALTFFLGKEMKQKELLSVIGMLALLIAYFSVEELMGSLLMVFLENHVDRNIGSVEISSSILIAINPLVVMTVGPLLARVGISLKTKTRLAISFAFLSLAFLALYLAALIELSSLLYVVIGFASIALGELFLAPTVFSFCSRVAPKGKSGLMMGLVTLAFSLASLLSGKASQLSYAPSTLFLMVSISAAFVPVLLYVGSFFQKLQSIQLR